MSQLPQCAASVIKLAQLSPHFWVPAAHEVVQAPFAQTAAPMQALPQVPQWAVANLTSTHSPLHATRPGWHSTVPAWPELPPELWSLLPLVPQPLLSSTNAASRPSQAAQRDPTPWFRGSCI